ncbi:hypothetical protein MPER_03989, partial [Moniliophthora perniciosa FA553]
MASAVKVDNTLGAAFIGFAASCFIFGILTAQCATYSRLFPQDKIIYKVLTSVIWYGSFNIGIGREAEEYSGLLRCWIKYARMSLNSNYNVSVLLG